MNEEIAEFVENNIMIETREKGYYTVGVCENGTVIYGHEVSRRFLSEEYYCVVCKKYIKEDPIEHAKKHLNDTQFNGE